ncbi:MAG: AAA family ATPase [Polyangiales bacterium]
MGSNDAHDGDSRFRGTERFAVVRPLGEGGMGVVYEVRDRDRELYLALKCLRDLGASEALRFKAEFRALRDVRHPNLVRLDELFEEDGQYFFTMELVDGVDFLAHVRGTADASRTGSTSGSASSREAMETVVGRKAPTTTVEAAPPEPEASPATPTYDEARLRSALVQLALGLDALHRAGLVHRDVKPSNLLVDRTGRLVILDFGVVAELSEGNESSAELVGTAAYMAPEQARGFAVGPSADWYAMGVVLFQSLSGRLPFQGAFDEVIERKVALDAPPVTAFAPDAPHDLVELATRLLERNPERRAGSEEVFARLGVDDEDIARLAGQTRGPAAFVGRVRELAALEAAAADAAAGRTVVAFVDGPSGVGKSALVAEALRAIRAVRPTLVLRGRCHEKEAVPYNAFDDAIDGLCRFLRRAGEERVVRWLPPTTSALVTVFPVLASVTPLVRKARGEAATGSDAERRARAFEELRALIAAIASERLVALSLDDLHWADPDSVALLEELVRPGQPCALLVLGTLRPKVGPSPWPARRVKADDVRAIDLGGLEPTDARALFERIAATTDARPLDVDALLAESAGHPMFLEELVRFAGAHEGRVADLRLDDAIVARASLLSETARRLLEHVVASDAPIAAATLARAAGVDPAACASQLAILHAERLVRLHMIRRDDSVEPYHDRVREAVYATLDEGRRARIHGDLGHALEVDGQPSEGLASHYARAGEHEAAMRHALRAADAAARALAFERSAAWYRFALELPEVGDEARRRLGRHLGEMLSLAGRPGESAAAFLEAAGVPGDAHGARDLRRRAAEQYLVGGYFAEGVEAARAALRDVGEHLVDGTTRTLLGVLWERYRLRHRTLDFEPRTEATASPDALERVDAFYSAGSGLSFQDPVRGMLYTLRGAREALDAGEPERCTRYLAAASLASAAEGDRSEATRLLQGAERAARLADTDMARFYARMTVVTHTYLMDNDWTRTYREAAEAETLWRSMGRTRGFEADLVDQFSTWAMDMLGLYPALYARIDRAVRAARRSGNLRLEIALRSFFAHLHAFLRDDVRTADGEVVAALSSWPQGNTVFCNPHYWSLKCREMIRSYQGRPELDRGELDVQWKRYEGTLLDRVGVIDIEAETTRGTTALLRAAIAKRRGRPSEVKEALAPLAKRKRRLARRDVGYARRAYLTLEAGEALVLGHDEHAIRAYEELLPLLDAVGGHAIRAASAQRLADLVGGSRAESLRGEAGAFLRESRIASPERFVSLFAPGGTPPDEL